MSSGGLTLKALSSEAPAEAAFRAVIRTYGLLERAMHPHFARFGISASQWGVLRALYRAEQGGREGMRLTDLSERLLVRPPSVTGVVARLEREGLVVRGSSPGDRRAKRVRLTEAGREVLRRVLEVHGRQVQNVMAGLDAQRCGELWRLLEQLQFHLDAVVEASAEVPGRAGRGGDKAEMRIET